MCIWFHFASRILGFSVSQHFSSSNAFAFFEPFKDFYVQILNEQKEKAQLQEVIKSGSVSDDVKSLLLSSSAPPPPPPVAAPPPPPPPPSGGAPPPPPPPGGVPPPPGAPPPPGVPASGLLLPKKSTPKPSNPLKSFNWSKLPESKISGTIWADLDDAKVSAPQVANVIRGCTNA